MKYKLSLFTTVIFLISCSNYKAEVNNQNTNKMETITLGAGCFWCVEAIYSDLKGVESVISGFSGGTIKNPSYKEVCTERTGHAEVCQLTFNPEVITFKEILEVFWQTHDPTTLNRQGADVGTRYRSAIFYHTEEQKQIAEAYLQVLNDEKAFENPIVTEITAYTNFYPAEDYHQDYFELNGEQPYCTAVVRPKVEKFRKIFKEKLK